MTATCVSMLLITAAATALGQGITIGVDGTGLGTGVVPAQGSRSDQPPPMASQPVARQPSGFWLRDAGGRRFGPYAYADGTSLGPAGKAPVMAAVTDTTFSLAQPEGPVHGPYDATNGSPIVAGGRTLFFERQPAQLFGRVSHASATAAPPAVSMAPLDSRVAAGLHELRNAFALLAQRLANDTADRAYVSVPTITYPSGRRRDNIVSRSPRDREQAVQSAESSASVQLERFLRDHLPTQLAVDGSGRFASPPLRPGTYLVCVTQKVADAEATSLARSRTAIWWTVIECGQAEQLTLELDAGNAINWRGIFFR